MEKKLLKVDLFLLPLVESASVELPALFVDDALAVKTCTPSSRASGQHSGKRIDRRHRFPNAQLAAINF
jgi:hypothetical protein